MNDAPNRPPGDPPESRLHEGNGDPTGIAGAHGAEPSAIPPTPPGLSDRFVQVFASPWFAMRSVAERPAAFLALLTVFVIMALYTAVNLHILIPEQTELQIEHARPEQIEALEQQINLFSDPPVWLRVAAGLGGGFSGALFAVFVPGLLLHIFLRLSEGQGTLRQTLGVVCWAALIPYGLRSVLSWVIIILTDSGRHAGLTLASLLPDPNPQSAFYIAAGLYGDPFMYWMLWVVVLGVMQAHRLAFGRAAVVTAATYVLLSAVPIGFSLLGQALSGR